MRRDMLSSKRLVNEVGFRLYACILVDIFQRLWVMMWKMEIVIGKGNC